jgi:hypothetical protein
VLATTEILNVPVGDLGALLVGVGAVLLLADVLSGGPGISGLTYGGTLRMPARRLSSGAEVAGSLLVALGSALLLLSSRNLTVLVVVLVLVLSALLIYLVMALRLHAHMRLLASENENEPNRSFVWCLLHPCWRPPPDPE